nr:MAG TPA: hypothetical protein [Caudoviricetes sp.]
MLARTNIQIDSCRNIYAHHLYITDHYRSMLLLASICIQSLLYYLLLLITVDNMDTS